MKPVLFYALGSMGMGHATRTEAVLRRLSEDYEIHVFCGGPARKHLAALYPNVHRIHRARYFFRGNRVANDLIFLYVWATFPLMVGSLAKLMWLMVRMQPVALCVDWEAQSTWAALLLRPFKKLPIVALDHMAMFRFADPPGLPEADRPRLKGIRRMASTIVPFADRWLVTNFATPPLSKEGARYVPTPIRKDALDRRAKARKDGPVVGYFGLREEAATLDRVLAETGLPFIVFGAPEDRDVGLVRYRRFQREAFFDALAAAPFYVANAGISSMTEAFALGKPVLAYPAAGQFEQEIMAHAVEGIGWGRAMRELSADAIKRFAEEAPRIAERVEKIDFDQDEFFAVLRATLREVSEKEP